MTVPIHKRGMARASRAGINLCIDYFFCGCSKIPNKTNLRKEELVLAHRSTLAGTLWLQNHAAAGDIVLSQEAETWMLVLSLLPFLCSVRDSASQNGTIHI